MNLYHIYFLSNIDITINNNIKIIDDYLLNFDYLHNR
jgi:hypothetical protein